MNSCGESTVIAMKGFMHRKSSNYLIVFAAVLLTCYLVAILTVTNVGQKRLEESQYRELHLKVQGHATRLEYFFGIAEKELGYLAVNKSVTTFFANLSSGMSMQYGLAASLFHLKQEMQKAVSTPFVLDEPMFNRVLLVSNGNTIIEDTVTDEIVYSQNRQYVVPEFSRVLLESVDVSGKIEVRITTPVFYSHKLVGFVVAYINPEVLVTLVASQEDDHSRMELSTKTGTLLIWDSLPKSSKSEGVYFDVAIGNTDFRIKSWFSQTAAAEIFTSAWFAPFLSFLSIPVLLGFFYIFKIYNTNIILTTKFKESHKRQVELARQNERLVQEVQMRVESQQKLAYQASHDSLTGLLNRSFGYDRLTQELLRAYRINSTVLVVFIDLDNFKQINDTQGHNAGDEILKKTSKRLLESVRSSDLVIRLGGDEFLLVIPDLLSMQSAKELATKIMSVFDVPFECNKQEFFLSTSIGMAVYPQDGENAQELLKNADTAMYYVKGEGRNGFSFYNRNMNADVQRSLDIDNRLRQALENNDLELYFQPIIEFSSGEIIGAEALMRWHDDILGPVSPSEFIPVSEKNGLIHKIGEFALQKACEYAAQWQAISPLKIAVNISSVQFRYCEQLQNSIETALHTSGLSPQRLGIEVTESLLLIPDDKILTLLEDLQSLGVEISIDDFGTGYSSLSYLQKFPFNKVKIDRSFLQGMRQSSSNCELVRAMNALAKVLGLKVVAEGVDDQWHIDYLRDIECDYGQGYLYSKPLSAGEFELYLKNSVNSSE